MAVSLAVRLVLAGALASVCLAASPPARADDSRGEGTGTRWYGWQILLCDATSAVVVPVVGTAIDPTGDGGVVVAAVVGSYLLAPPIAHLAHGRGEIAAASLGLRAGLPVIGAFIGAGAASGSSGGGYSSELSGAAVGFVLGVIGAVTVDVAVLSHEKRSSEAAPSDASDARRGARAPAVGGMALTPVVGPRKEGGFDLGVAATF